MVCKISLTNVFFNDKHIYFHVFEMKRNLPLSFFVFYRPKETAAESTSQSVSGPCGKKHLSGSYRDNDSQFAGLHQASETLTPQKRPANGASGLEVCYSST